MIKFYVAMLLAAVCAVDRFAFEGRYYVETRAVARDVSNQLDYWIKDKLQPLGGYFRRA